MHLAWLKSFSYNNEGGYEAGVILLDCTVSNKIMQEMAEGFDFPETAFIYKNKRKEKNIYDIRFFTPKCEVHLCGHATIASFYLLAKLGKLDRKEDKSIAYQDTKAGRVKIEVNYEGDKIKNVFVYKSKPKEYGVIKDKRKKRIADSLNIKVEDIGLEKYELEPTIVYTGLSDILIPVKSREILNNIKPDVELIFDISYEEDVVGYHVFTIEDNQLYARNFAPAAGIDEECATGSSNCGLVYFLYKRNIIDSSVKIIQGEAMNEKSLVYCNINETELEYYMRFGGEVEEVNII